MALDIAFLLVGGLGLYYGAEWLVRGASRMARALGVPPLVIGLTVVSYGTSAPELVVSLVAALRGQSGIVLGNVVGSNIANIGLILGLTALIAPPTVDGSLRRRELPFLVLATAALPLALLDGRIGRFEAGPLFAGAALFTYATLRWARGEEAAAPVSDEVAELVEGAEHRSKLALAGLILLGLAVLAAAGEVFIIGAAGIARALGMSERLVGLTIVALGTSLPELAASVVAALRGHSELAVGNVLGSNLFNILLVLGVSGVVRPIEGSLEKMSFELAILGVLTLLCIVSMRRERIIGRWEGTVFTGLYAAFLVGLGVLR